MGKVLATQYRLCNQILKTQAKLGVAVCACDPSGRGSHTGQSRINEETLSQKKSAKMK